MLGVLTIGPLQPSLAKHHIMQSIERYEIAICEAMVPTNIVNSGKVSNAALHTSVNNLAEYYG